MASETARTGEGAAHAGAPATVDSVAALVAAREAAGMSSQELAAVLKLAPRQVLALEQGDWAALPGLAFVRAALRGYGRVIRVEVGPLLASLPVDAMAPPELRPATSLKTPLPRQGMLGFGAGGSGSRLAWIGLTVLVLVALVLFFGRESDLAAIPSLLRMDSAEPAPSPAPSPAPGSDANRVLVPTPASRFVNAHGAAVAPASGATSPPRPVSAPSPEPVMVSQIPSGNPMTVTAGPVLPQSVAATPPAATSPQTVAAEPPSSAPPAPATAAGTAAPVPFPAAPPPGATAPELRLNFVRDAWVEVRRADGRAIVGGLQRRDAELRLPLDDELNLSIANARFVRLERDGRPIDLKPLMSQQGVARLRLAP